LLLAWFSQANLPNGANVPGAPGMLRITRPVAACTVRAAIGTFPIGFGHTSASGGGARNAFGADCKAPGAFRQPVLRAFISAFSRLRRPSVRKGRVLLDGGSLRGGF
jgi:hypothetical protein